MLHIIRTEEDEQWENLEFRDMTVGILDRPYAFSLSFC